MGMFNSNKEIAFVTLAVFLFFATNFTPQMLGVIYVLMLFVYAVVLENEFPEYNIFKGKFNMEMAMPLAAGAIVAYLFIISQIFSYFGAAADIFQPESIINILAAGISPPVITENPYIYLFVYGLLIPIAETLFFLGALLPYIERKVSKNMLFAIIIIGAVVTLWHYTAHGFSDTALMADFVFFSISGALVLYKKDLLTPLLMHIIINSWVVAVQVGLLV